MSIPLYTLIIEDSEDDALLLTLRLRDGGYDPHYERVETPEQLSAALSRQRWDIVLSDHNMPRLSAPQALRIVRESGLDIPFIIISGKMEEELAASIMRSGAHDYLSKENLTRLIPVIERELREVAMRRDRRHTAAALQASELMLRLVVDNAGDAVIIADQDARILLFNRAAESLLGYRADEVIGKSIDLLMTPDDARAYRRRTRPGMPVGNFTDIKAMRKDGSIVWVDVAVSETQSGGRPLFTSILHDVNDRRRAEREKLQNEMMRIELEKEREMIELKERFISMVTHEFRTPLTVIYSSCEILTRYFVRLPVDKQMERIRTIQDMSQYMVELLNDVLLVSQGKAGKLPFNPQSMDVRQMCDSVLENAQLSDKKQHQLTLEFDGDLRPIQADEKLLQSILVNLLGNAVKYTPEGKGITLRLNGTAEQIVIEVQDEGIGIPPGDLDHLFEPFHRAENVHSIEGTGLGLAIVKNAVDAHGGSISVTSVLDQGTTFTVRLPRGD